MKYETYKKLAPAALGKVKADIIFKNCILESSDNFQWAGFDGAFKKAFIKGDPLQSLLEKYRSKLETEIEKTVAAFEENT